MHLVEQVGSGVGRIQELMQAAGLPQPGFLKDGMFTLVLTRTKPSSGQIVQVTTKKLSVKMSEKMSEKILRLIGENNSVTTEEIASLLGKSTRTIERQIKQLKEQGKIERIGPDKGGYWKIIKQ
jgi:ATP-dependent DNA helicase RecG